MTTNFQSALNKISHPATLNHSLKLPLSYLSLCCQTYVFRFLFLFFSEDNVPHFIEKSEQQADFQIYLPHQSHFLLLPTPHLVVINTKHETHCFYQRPTTSLCSASQPLSSFQDVSLYTLLICIIRFSLSTN